MAGRPRKKSVIAESRAKRADNPTLFAFLPAQHKTELTNAIVALEAARTTLQKKGSPRLKRAATPNARWRAGNAPPSRSCRAAGQLMVAGVRVFQAGGQGSLRRQRLADRINRAARSSAIRLYSQFDAADHDMWSRCWTRRARQPRSA